jgi:hypothetical protein
LSTGPSLVPPAALVSPEIRITEHLARAKDPVLVARLDDGGLISYRKPGGSYVHTLNTLNGFERKLQHLGIVC